MGNSVGANVGQAAVNQPTPDHTPIPTPEETAKNQGFIGESVGVYGSVGKNDTFKDFYSVDVSDDELPEEWRTPTPPKPPNKETHTQLVIG